MEKIIKKLKLYSELLKFEHTIFALPFGLASLLILYKVFPSWGKIIYILGALVSARTLGMAFNRLIDKPFDEKNPRTSIWPHAKGLVKDWEIKLIILFSSLLFIFFCYKINFLALLLSPIVIFFLFIYPFAKRFTYFPHLFLGLVYFLIPIAIDIALNENVSLIAIFLAGAMACWVASFDILYSLQDIEFDKKMGLKSIPVKFGIKNALRIAKFLHLITFFLLLLTGYFYPKTTWIYFVGLILIAIFLTYEHSLIKENDLSKINKAFFTVNGFISIIFFLVILINNLYYHFLK
ncbi:4-hydroxybenzoate polyprenyltransferase [Thermodesulfobacterium geofontis OPF15]|jgi:4-hydroxybenzoate polyprenyltransferase|uniref:4-hydroxybenzoate polyprenyltransferase n=1 Tax=Thermodesulfobacterium geofontis (strain OPF15) TaxID=795359 RepID=F8C2V9_THEGP|nr:UbiA-like polyprenyltransferase [Thermodesulfobacterium geofontis]AEH22336.1 4-hydroxybenzoate polyprenyltransferase [Thermodesulfobacterium geofontis OPF15]